MRLWSLQAKAGLLFITVLFHIAVSNPIIKRDVLANIENHSSSSNDNRNVAATHQVHVLDEGVFGGEAGAVEGNREKRLLKSLGVSAVTAVGSGIKAASVAGVKAVGKIGLAGAKTIGSIGLAGAKAIGSVAVKLFSTIGVKLAKAAVTLGLAKFVLNLVLGVGAASAGIVASASAVAPAKHSQYSANININDDIQYPTKK